MRGKPAGHRDDGRRDRVAGSLYAGVASILLVQTGKYNAVLRELAASYGATTVDLLDTKVFETRATLSQDGNHPNGAGDDAIARI